MSEKRFACKVKKKGDIEYVLFIDTREDVEYMSFFEILDLVNNLYNENEQLKQEHKVAIDEMITDYKELEKENEQLKSNCDIYKIPTNCDECQFLGTNGICGYCKFTLECYDGKNDLINGKVLPNCPFTKTKEG